jgi:hypothetical protein
MTTADVLTELALSLAGSGMDRDEAVRQLLARAGDHRVAVVRAQGMVLERLEGRPEDQTASRAGEFLEDVLGQLTV